MAAAMRLAMAETPADELLAMLPVDFLQRCTIAAFKAGDAKLTGDLAYRWAEFVHPKKTDNRALTVDDVKQIADAARAEAARRGYDVEIADRPAAGTLPN